MFGLWRARHESGEREVNLVRCAVVNEAFWQVFSRTWRG